jgi:hypothetical protein
VVGESNAKVGDTKRAVLGNVRAYSAFDYYNSTRDGTLSLASNTKSRSGGSALYTLSLARYYSNGFRDSVRIRRYRE